MTDDDARWREHFPQLFAEAHVDYADCTTGFTTADAPDHLVSRLHLVAVTPQGHVVACRSEQGWRFLPGGTREPEETSRTSPPGAAREAGAVLTGSVRHFTHVADSNRARPFRPHLPHPRTYWSYGRGVEVTGPPAPARRRAGGEVLALPPSEAAEYLAHHDPLHADVLRLAPPPACCNDRSARTRVDARRVRLLVTREVARDRVAVAREQEASPCGVAAEPPP